MSTACCKGEKPVLMWSARGRHDGESGPRRRTQGWVPETQERAHTASIKRREIRHRPVDFHRERKRSEGEEGAGNLCAELTLPKRFEYGIWPV